VATPQLQVEARTIVVRGSFNPLIFQPAWFRAEGLVMETDLDPENLPEDSTVITHDLVQFDGGWMTLQVTGDRFTLSVNEADMYEVARDLVADTFERLRHSPVIAVGLNKHVHYSMPTHRSWDDLGVKLAPRENWADVLQSPGMRSLLVEAVRPDQYAGNVFVRVEPSGLVNDGVFVEVNDHFQFGSVASREAIPRLLEILREQWVQSEDRASAVIRHTLALVPT